MSCNIETMLLTTGGELVQTTQLYDAVCECSLERWFRETPTRWTMLITTELATIVGERCWNAPRPQTWWRDCPVHSPGRSCPCP